MTTVCISISPWCSTYIAKSKIRGFVCANFWQWHGIQKIIGIYNKFIVEILAEIFTLVKPEENGVEFSKHVHYCTNSYAFYPCFKLHVDQHIHICAETRRILITFQVFKKRWKKRYVFHLIFSLFWKKFLRSFRKLFLNYFWIMFVGESNLPILLSVWKKTEDIKTS